MCVVKNTLCQNDNMKKSIKLTLYKPFDAHIHLRDASALPTTVKHAEQQFSGVIAMPNLTPPIVDETMATQYYQQILAHSTNKNFTPYTTLYLTETTQPKDIEAIAKIPYIIGVKWYPKGVTTNSAQGASNLNALKPVLSAMESHKVPLLIHGESPKRNVDIFARELQFIQETLSPLIKSFPELKISLEHISTQQAVEFIKNAPDNVAATITAHHLLYNRNDLLSGGIKPHLYCLPILKKEADRQALINAATSGNPKFFLGTDSAPHSQETKETACGCAGVYTAHAAIEFYASVFEQANALDKLESFASLNARYFYNLPTDKLSQITLIKKPWTIPASYNFSSSQVVPLGANETLPWQINNTLSP